MNNIITFILTIFSDIILAVKKVWVTPNLPENLIKFKNYPIIRLIRVLGGISTILLLSQRLTNFILVLIATFFALLFLCLHICLSFYKIKHIRYIFKNNKLDLKNKRNSQSSGIFLFLLNYFNINTAEGQEPVVSYIMGVATLSLVALFCVINIIIYLTVIIVINKNDNIALAYNSPRLKWFINKYNQTTKFFIVFEFILLTICLFIIFMSSAILIKQMFLL